jgi:hypothetical protein
MNILNLKKANFLFNRAADENLDIINEIKEKPFSSKMKWAQSFWNNLRGVNKMPARGDFKPSDIMPIMGNVVLINVKEDGQNGEKLIFRLIASNIANGMGRDYTGVSLADIPAMKPSLKKLEWVIRNKEPFYYSDVGLPWKPSWVTPFKFLALPLSNDGENVNMIMLFLE